MAVFLDSGFFFALITKKDPYHLVAVRLLRECSTGIHGMVFTSNFILDESMTLVHVRIGSRPDLLEKMASFFIGSRKIANLIDISTIWLKDIVEMHVKLVRDGTDASFTDCSSIIACKMHSITKIISFDGHFAGFLEQLKQ
jgi:predicted nucleic acid-binding protein